ncbi:Lipase [Macleaya cordata]|uniref:Lipase n=1 Tax=Macleaya cordata TaxID=56857 RepID=A0A200PZF1_MACCD|nr:Lipase [Macleaya cordata]
MDEQNKQLVFSSVLLFIFFTALLTGAHVVEGSSSSSSSSSSSDQHHHHHHQNDDGRRDGSLKKLFVFGDSYADTGNNKISITRSWKFPYGVTFPGKPTGRFSDGRVFTDYIASFMGIRSPIPYRWRKIGKNLLQHGMNFAYGGTGVFDTLVPEPNMTTQIKFFDQLVVDGVYTKRDLDASIALVSVAGNDYSAYTARNGTVQGLPAFITTVVNQMSLNLKQIHGLGVKKIAVTALEPLGCLPDATAMSSYQKCNGTVNQAVGFHNLLLQQMVQKLNNETKGSPFVILDFYSAFMSVFKKQANHPATVGPETVVDFSANLIPSLYQIAIEF